MYTNTSIIALFLALATSAFAGRSAGVSRNFKRAADNPFDVAVFNGNKPDGSLVSSTVDFDVGSTPLSLSYPASCGTITVTQVTKKEMNCVYVFPATMPAGVSSFTDPANAFTVQIPQACAGRTVNVDNSCGDCGSIGELIGAQTCNGDKNILNVCNNNGVLAAC